MNRRALQSHIFLIFSAMVLLVAFAVPYASAEFYVIAGSRGAGTEIKSLPYTISASGFYYITKDLSCAAGTHGITIGAHDVTLDLMGFSLLGPGGDGDYDGIYMNGRVNVEIRNGTVRRFPRNGIYEEDTSVKGHRILNIRVRNNGNYGIFLKGKNNIIKNCTVVGNTIVGICAYSGSIIDGNTCYQNNFAGIIAGQGCTVTGNTCYENDDYGITADRGSTVTGNSCCYNNEKGINLGGDNLVDQNCAYGNGETDITPCITCVFGDNIGAP